MKPHYADDWLTVYGGDIRDILPTLPADSVDCIVTSPPYWGLRDYGTATWIGGDAGCDHQSTAPPRAERPSNGLTGGKATIDAGTITKANCGRCGATRQDGQLGLEATPEAYVANLVGVFRELRRILKPSGTAWLNLGDSYANGGGMGGSGVSAIVGSTKANVQSRGQRIDGLAQKQLVGIPWRIAFALQADGWWLRSDIIWAKPNPMPESVTDRPTKAHEYLFLLTKAERYYFDQEAVREEGAGRLDLGKMKFGGRINGDTGWHNDGLDRESGGRNLRSVWTIATRPYPGAHFAVFPPELPERCIKAGSSERGVCPECGAPSEREVERTTRFEGGSGKAGRTAEEVNGNGKWAGIQYGTNIKLGPVVDSVTTGWTRSCGHDLEPEPAVVLDPFAGSGTVGMVANRLSRKAILIDLNPAYLEQQMVRNAQVPVGL